MSFKCSLDIAKRSFYLFNAEFCFELANVILCRMTNFEVKLGNFCQINIMLISPLQHLVTYRH